MGFSAADSARSRSDFPALLHELAQLYHDRVRRIPGVRTWGPDFAASSRAPTVSITLGRHSAAEAAAALDARGLCV